MSKKKIIILSVIVILIGIASILSTYALDITMTKGTSSNYDMSLTFDISGNVNKELSVEAGKTKTFDIVVNNPYTDTITYGIAYKMLNPTTKPDDLIIAVTNISENPSEGMIDANSKKVISLIIVNNSTSNIQVSLSVINGYKNGGDLIIPTGYTIISDIYEVGSTTHKKIDNSGANYPDLVEGLIPAVYNTTTSKWVKADTESSTSTYGWYDYTQKKWANAVLVTEANRATYKTAAVGTNITESDILAYYVWIPRYKYKVWNKDKVVGTQSYNAKTEGIDIVFENNTDSTGTIVCNDYSYSAPSSEAGSPNETCTGSNGDYYTHPAFTFEEDKIRGFWIGKFELSSETPTASNGGGKTTTLTPRILPNVISWRGNTISNFNTVIQNMQVSSNIYGLSTDKSTTDSHMLTNMEWGAVAYLTNSNYGRCSNGTCTEITINNCNTYTTGIGADIVSANASSTTCTTEANKYNGEKGVLASTTGNVYGVYDMSGGAYEYVMGNMSSTADTYTFHSYSAGFASSWYNSNQKYVNTYARISSSSDRTIQKACNAGRLGDATGEVVFFVGGDGGWYNDCAYFPYSSLPWFNRGGTYQSGSKAGMFCFISYNGGADSTYSTRATLVVLRS